MEAQWISESGQHEKRKKKLLFKSPDPQNLNWSQDTNTFGKKLMSDLGWRGGGLGANQDGNPDFVKVKRNIEGRGIGCKGNENDMKFQEKKQQFDSVLQKLNQIYKLNGQTNHSTETTETTETKSSSPVLPTSFVSIFLTNHFVRASTMYDPKNWNDEEETNEANGQENGKEVKFHYHYQEDDASGSAAEENDEMSQESDDDDDESNDSNEESEADDDDDESDNEESSDDESESESESDESEEEEEEQSKKKRKAQKPQANGKQKKKGTTESDEDNSDQESDHESDDDDDSDRESDDDDSGNDSDDESEEELSLIHI
eukprot:TRINITY_DN2726_c0_g1_i2.p1 TRINITY_DN2726_c0_g1~~TRINITY_DN2726_c0_g1_i2.p1  ORF type:complete len:317 (+),score=97.51 TRINITY_DN2726_c0_g1_i2:100-1050(+)